MDGYDRRNACFTRTFDLLTWLLPATNHFPRAHRHTFTARMLDAAFDWRERREEANVRRGVARRVQQPYRFSLSAVPTLSAALKPRVAP